nr:hypothetical protein GCM10017745_23570 [Saccharothrix mutabilis subsp. capreolus]
MHTVAVLSLKGGVGKTTVALGLASAALRRGVRTLVIDLDPQCNATSTLEPEDTDASIYDVLREPTVDKLRAAVSTSAWGDGVDVLSGSEDAELLNHPDPGESRLGGCARRCGCWPRRTRSPTSSSCWTARRRWASSPGRRWSRPTARCW